MKSEKLNAMRALYRKRKDFMNHLTRIVLTPAVAARKADQLRDLDDFTADMKIKFKLSNQNCAK